MRTGRLYRFWMLVGFLAGAFMVTGCEHDPPIRGEGLDVAEALAADTAGYARAVGPRDFTFPADHGPHPDFRTEWWYYTGNLVAQDGRRFGYQFTIFRTAVSPDTVSAESSGWATNQLYMAHLAVSDPEAGDFQAFERFSRGGAGLAGSEAQPFRVWLEGWEATSVDGSFERQTIRAEADGVTLDLSLEAVKPIVLQGDGGYDPKGPEPGNASYYYSLTRWRTEGAVTVGGVSRQVTGSSWLDREWSTSVLGEGVEGWDWFSLQLSDGRDIMFYQLRDEEGTRLPYSTAAVVLAGGQKVEVDASAIELEATEHWTSPRGGSYPSRWTMTVPSEGLELDIRPVMADQELDVSIRYWEGAVDVHDAISGTDLGRGFVEMTGYSSTERSRLARH